MPFVLMLFTINVYAQNDVDCYKGDCLNGLGVFETMKSDGVIDDSDDDADKWH